MSAGFAAVPNWLVEEPTVSSHEKLVYLVLSSKIGDQGAWFISHSQIAEMAGISVSSVQRALSDLRERGVVTWSPRHNDAGQRIGNQYRLMTDRLGQGDRPPRSEGPTPSVSVTEQNKNPEKEPITTPPTPSDPLFDAIWNVWPKKVAESTARNEWRKVPASEREERSRQLVAHGKAHRMHTPKEFWPRLSAYIRDTRWNEPLPEPRPQQRGGKPVRTLPPGVKQNDAWMYQ